VYRIGLHIWQVMDRFSNCLEIAWILNITLHVHSCKNRKSIAQSCFCCWLLVKGQNMISQHRLENRGTGEKITSLHSQCYPYQAGTGKMQHFLQKLWSDPIFTCHNKWICISASRWSIMTTLVKISKIQVFRFLIFINRCVKVIFTMKSFFYV